MKLPSDGPKFFLFFFLRRTAQLASQREVGRPTCWHPYIQRVMEIPLDLSLLSTQRGQANQCPWSEELTDEALSVASPTCNVLIAVINSPRQHLEAVWAINERVRQWRSVLFCGLQDKARGAANAFIEQAEDLEHARTVQTPARFEWCNRRRCCFHRLWRGFAADGGGGHRVVAELGKGAVFSWPVVR